MHSKLSWLILLLLLLASTVTARNRFPVFSYSDYKATLNKAQFYRDLDSFGVSHFLTYVPDSSAYFRLRDSLAIDFFSHFWRYELFYDAAHTMRFLETNEKSVNGRMSGFNTNPVEGYKCEDTAVRGDQFPDPSIGENVRRARRGINPIGYLQNRFVEGTFDGLNKHVDVEQVRFDARLRLGELNVPDTTVVAVLTFEDLRQVGPCNSQTTWKYRIERLDDRSLIVGTTGGLDTVPTIDTLVDTTVAKYVRVPDCGNLLKVDSIDARKFANVSYQSGTEIVGRCQNDS